MCLDEHGVNAHPLAQAGADATELDVITANHFLLGTSWLPLPVNLRSDFEQRKRYARIEPTLTPSGVDVVGSTSWLWIADSNGLLRQTQDLKSDDLATTIGPTIPWNYFLLGRIVKFNYEGDAKARSAELKTMSRSLIRPIVKPARILPPP